MYDQQSGSESLDERVKEAIYQKRRGSFAFKHAELKLHEHYHSERDDDPHRHPRSGNHVPYIYPKPDLKVNFRGQQEVTHLNPQRKGIRGKKEYMFVRTNSFDSLNNAAGRQTYMSAKDTWWQNGETFAAHHSSFNNGRNVVSAGFLYFNEQGKITHVVGTSGHYWPDRMSLMKFAEFGAQTGQFNPDQIEWSMPQSDPPYSKRLDMNPRIRRDAVLNWVKGQAGSEEQWEELKAQQKKKLKVKQFFARFNELKAQE